MKLTLAKVRKAARELLTREERDERRLFEGNALLRRLVRIGVLTEDKMKLDYVLGLKIEDFLERRLQTQVRLLLCTLVLIPVASLRCSSSVWQRASITHAFSSAKSIFGVLLCCCGRTRFTSTFLQSASPSCQRAVVYRAPRLAEAH